MTTDAEGPVPAPDGRPTGPKPIAPAKRAVFWAITLLLPPLLLWGTLEVGLRLSHRQAAVVQPGEIARGLEESREAEVGVVRSASLRGLVRPSASREIVYEMKPGRSWLFVGATTRTNSLGFRGREYAAGKPAGTLRIVGLGDSVMFGWGVAEEDAYMGVLERNLSASLGRVEVLNLAVPGYNTMQEAAVLEEKGVRLDPDLILINYCLNDWAAPFFVADPDKDGSLVDKSLLFRRLSQRLGRDAEHEFGGQGMDKVEAALDRIAAAARARGAPVVFFVHPQPIRPEGRRGIVRMAEDRGFTYVDLYAAFDAYCKERGLRGLADLVLNPEDGHPNPEAHRLIARTLEPTLLGTLQARRTAAHRP